MQISKKMQQDLLDAVKAGIVATLCVLMLTPEAVAAVVAGGYGSATGTRMAPLTRNEKTLQVLNRFTFGPRPGDEAAVDRMGLEAWFERQLHPERIDDSGLDARLAEYPALALTPGELMERYPSPGMLRAVEKRDLELPNDAVEHAIYADSIAFYATARKKQEAGAAQVASAGGMAAANMATTNMASGDLMTAQAPATDAATTKKGKHKFDGTPMDADEVAAVIALAPEQRMARLVGMSPEEMMSFRAGLHGRDMVDLLQGLTPQEREDVEAMQGGVRLIGEEALTARMLRDVYSDRQLQAVMDDFWLNHFNVYVRKNENEPYLLSSYERDAILPNALGKFEDLLVATAESPAMLMYLDNWESIGPNSPAAERVKQVALRRPDAAKNLPKGINENYGRELMELHTLGVGGGYTQKDVIEVAKCFTGWTINRPYGRRAGMNDGMPGEFAFDPNRHEPGSKVVLGHVIAEGGMKEGLEVLHILATSPATAHFISKELAERFVSDTPPPALVNRMAATFLRSDGDIRAVLMTMFHSPEFWSPAVYRAKVKTPIEFVASALRASEAEVKNPLPLVQAMAGLGMPIYGMQTPNGYSWTADEWVSSNALVSRMNFALVLSSGRLPGVQVNWPQVLGDGANPEIAMDPTPETELRLETVILGEPAGVHTRQTVLANFNDGTMQQQAAENFAKTENAAGQASLMRVKGARYGGYGKNFQRNKPETPLDTMAGLLLGSPDFQRR